MRILLVEDDELLGSGVSDALECARYAHEWVRDGKLALAAAQEGDFDLIILDLGLPDTTGFEVLRQLRSHPDGRGVPVIFLTARAEEIDRILGLELGADDYVTKPFSPREVAARVRAILRREARFRSSSAAPESDLVWQHDPDALRIAFHGQAIDLTRYEYLLLALLLSAPGRVFTREQIMRRVWANAPDTADRSIDTHIKTLRAKLRGIDPVSEAIVTHRGSGYSINSISP